MMLSRFYAEWISPQRWLERAGARPSMRIAVGLVLLTSCVLLLTEALQLIPSADQANLHARSLLAEMASSRVVLAAVSGDYAGMAKFFNRLVERHEDVLSVGVRRLDGTIIFETPTHEQEWRGAKPGVNTPTHIRVPMFYGKHCWAQLELSFKPLIGPTWIAWCSAPPVKMAIFILATSFLFYWFFLSRMLKVLDPSSAVPDRMQLLLDTLVEGVVVIDNNDQVVMVNESFARTTFLPVDRLLGKSLSSLPWQTKGDLAASAYPWHTVQESGLPARGVTMRLQIGTQQDRYLNVNASPIFDAAGKRCGVIVTFDDQTAVESDNLQLTQLVQQFGQTSDEIHKLRSRLSTHGDDDYLATLEHLAQTARDIADASAPFEKHNIIPSLEQTENKDKASHLAEIN